MTNKQAKTIREASTFQETLSEYEDAVIHKANIHPVTVEEENAPPYLLAQASATAAYDALVAVIDAYCAGKMTEQPAPPSPVTFDAPKVSLFDRGSVIEDAGYNAALRAYEDAQEKMAKAGEEGEKQREAGREAFTSAAYLAIEKNWSASRRALASAVDAYAARLLCEALNPSLPPLPSGGGLI